MAFGTFSGSRSSAPMAEINVIPLVDIMLVLLVVFIISAPLLTHAVKIDLPQASSAAEQKPVDKVQVGIDAAGQVYWNGEPLDRAALIAKLQLAGQQQPTPELHVHADKNTRYEVVAELMSEAGKAGVTKLGFVTDPSGAAVTPVKP
jgi:biopolymer transport protein ExbD